MLGEELSDARLEAGRELRLLTETHEEQLNMVGLESLSMRLKILDQEELVSFFQRSMCYFIASACVYSTGTALKCFALSPRYAN